MRMDEEVETTVIIPAYNEEKGLPIVLEALERLSLSSLEVIVVDDGSTDGTAEVAKRYSCRLVSHACNRGKGAAMHTGIAASRGKKIIFIDADGTYPVHSIPDIVALLDAYDMVVGWRTFEHSNIRTLNRLGNFLVRKALCCLYGVSSRDPLTGLYGVRRNHLLRMELGSTDFSIETEITIKAARMGLKVANLPIAYHPRIGKTKLRPFRDGYRILKMVFEYMPLYAPGVVFLVPGMAISAIGLVLLVSWIISGRSGAWSAGVLALGLAVLIGVQSIMLGMAVKLYTVAYKSTFPDRVTKMLLSPRFKAGMRLFSLGVLGAGLALWARFILAQLTTASGALPTAREAELASVVTAFGLQLVISTSFLSLFVKEVLRRRGSSEVEGKTGEANCSMT